MNITVVNHTEEKIDPKRLRHALKMVLMTIGTKKLRNKKWLTEKEAVVLIFLPRAEMQKLNLKYRKKNKPTDVLSFSSDDPSALGELVFCIPVLKKQAKEQKHSLELELLYMLIHGVLHLLGYDHELSKKEEKLMFQIQDACFDQVCHLPKVF